MANIKKGDLVQLISGRSQARGGDRGKQGRVLEVQVDKNRVVVEGLNFITKHSRVGQSQRGTKTGGIETLEAPIHVSNLQLVNPDTKQPARVGFRVETDDRGKSVRVRYFKDSRRTPVKKAAKAGSAKADSVVSDSVVSDSAATDSAPTDSAPKAGKPAKASTKAAAAPKAKTASKAKDAE